MKKTLVLTAMFCLCFQAIAVFAATPDFSGTWELDVSKSLLPEMMRIESMTLRVSQTAKELKTETTMQRGKTEARPQTGGMNGGMRGSGMGGSGMQSVTYNLDGKEMTTDFGAEAMSGKETKTALITSDGKLSLTLTRNINGQMGSITMKTNDTWELLDGGKTLKIVRYSESPRGATNAELYFTKKSADGTLKTVEGQPSNGGTMMSKQISGGVLNGKATNLVKPEYPPAARAVKASGAVNVQVTIDEQGNVISVSAVSGHPLLRQAAEEAARSSKFAPTMLQGVPVKVTGIIVYSFTP